jgi:dihydroxyacid dehydratase/phosphogluconate dehydratase
VEEGDEIVIDIPERSITLAVDDAEIDRRRAAMLTRGAAAWTPRERKRRVSPGAERLARRRARPVARRRRTRLVAVPVTQSTSAA